MVYPYKGEMEGSMRGLYVYSAIAFALGVSLCAFSKIKEDEDIVSKTLLGPKDVGFATEYPPLVSEKATVKKDLSMIDSKRQLAAPEVIKLSKESAKGLYITINAMVKPNKLYEITIESADDNPLFSFSQTNQPAMPKTITEEVDPVKKTFVIPTLLDRFFNINKRRFIFNAEYIQKPELLKGYTIPQAGNLKIRLIETSIASYMDTIDAIDSVQAQIMVAQQGIVTRSRNYFLEKLLKIDPVIKAKTLAKAALEKFNTSMQDALAGNDYSIKNVNLFDPKQFYQNPKAGMIYNVIREFGQVIGFEMPSIEKPWYVRHKGKVALTASALALLTYMHYSNALGTRTSGIQSANQAMPAAAPVQDAKPSFAMQMKTNAANYVRDITAKAAISQAASATKSVQVDEPSTLRGWAENKVGGFLYKTLIEREAARIQNAPAPQQGFWARQVNKVVDKALPEVYSGWAGYQPKILPTK